MVTGGAGFIGGALVERLLSMGHRVVCVDSLTYAANRARLDEHVTLGLDFLEIDIADALSLADAINQTRPGVIFHLAAESHVDRSIDGPATFIKTNVVGTMNLLEASMRYWKTQVSAANDFRLVCVSTDEVFGSAPPDGAFDETTNYDPQSPYSASKAAADHLVRAWNATYGLPTLVTNCSNNFGPFQFPEKFIPHTAVRALTGKTIPIYGDGRHVRDWLHVNDHVEGLLLAASKGEVGGTYLFGGRNTFTNLEVAERICGILDDLLPCGRPYRSLLEFVPDRPGHDRRYAIDPSRAESELGWSAETDFQAGLKETVSWYVNNQAWWSEILAGGYQAERLGVRR
jgi:dTDP-glucose 4,6-dehydratase